MPLSLESFPNGFQLIRITSEPSRRSSDNYLDKGALGIQSHSYHGMCCVKRCCLGTCTLRASL